MDTQTELATLRAQQQVASAVPEVRCAQCAGTNYKHDPMCQFAGVRPAISVQQQAASVVPEDWREELQMTIDRLENDAETHDRRGYNSAGEDRRARAHAIRKMLAAVPPTVPAEKGKGN